ncbi:MAG TPA: M67 family metallopeptidase [Anaerolineales bacterium]|nr:M67 family metallopeptidase [Anaerolineales bacterium]
MLEISPDLLVKIHANGEQAYPEEGAGFLLGVDGETRRVLGIRPLPNARESAARHNRYIITPQDYLDGEREADRLKLTVLGVFHSHPDHPNQPSDYDRDWAQPFFSYVITSVQKGKAVASRSWRLLEDRSAFVEEPVRIGKSIHR